MTFHEMVEAMRLMQRLVRRQGEGRSPAAMETRDRLEAQVDAAIEDWKRGGAPKPMQGRLL